MKIIHFSKHNAGGAGIAASRIHKLLLEMGHDSYMYVQHLDKVEDRVLAVKSKEGRGRKYMFFSRIVRKLRRVLKHEAIPSADFNRFKNDDVYCFADFDETKKSGFCPNLVNEIDLKDVDIIFIHQIHDFLNSYDVKHLYEKTHARIIYTMMDMAPITGGYHYAWDYRGFETMDFNCPALPYSLNTLAHFQLMAKAENMAYTKAEIMSNAFYDLDFARSSAIKFSPLWHYYYPIDDSVYGPLALKKEKGVKCLFSIANFPADIRKGFTYVLQTLMFLDSVIDEKSEVKKIKFLCLDDSCFSEYRFNHIEFEKFAFCKNVDDLVKVYNQADIFLCTSVEDSAPMMLEEALLCGVPTVSFDVGTAKQFIKDGKNGYVAKRFDVVDFRQKVYKMLFEPPKTLQSPKQIHDGMAKICGKKAVQKQFEDILQNRKDKSYYYNGVK